MCVCVYIYNIYIHICIHVYISVARGGIELKSESTAKGSLVGTKTLELRVDL